MNYFDLYSSYPDETITAAWDSQVREAAEVPWFAEILRGRGAELFPRFAVCYAELRALPRNARRTLQRETARSRDLLTIYSEWHQLGGWRALQHKLAHSLAGAALLLALAQGVATAATITVTTNNPNIISDGQCSLIEAIVNANNDAATFPDCAAGSGADTIVLPANAKATLKHAYDNTYGPTGLPLITSPITIQGNGSTIVRRGGPRFRLIAVSNSGDLTLQNVTLSGGSSHYDAALYHQGYGGGALNYGSLTIEGSTISGNAAGFGGGVSNRGTLTIQNTTITKNRASDGNFNSGGGVLNLYGDVTIRDSTISNNLAANKGGGVINRGPLTIQNSTISGNSAVSGGGVSNTSYYGFSSLIITNSTITGNRADRGGGVYNCSCYFGYGYTGLTLNRSLISGNNAGAAPEISNYGTVTADNFNLFGVNGNAGVTGFVPGLTDIVPARGVKLKNIVAPLKNNGGSTQTHALAPGSPALDAVSLLDPSCAGTDQRGVARPQGPGCDIGAFERNVP